MAPKKAPVEEPKPEAISADDAPSPSTVWIYGINDHLDVRQELPAGFAVGKTLRGDYQKLCQGVGAVAHPALKLRIRPPAPAKPAGQERRGSKPGLDLAGMHAAMQQGRRASKGAVDMTGAAQWGARDRKPSDAGAPEAAPLPPEETELPVLKVSSMLLDRVTMNLLGLLLPGHSHKIKVLCFSDCRLDVDMLNMLHRGLVGQCSVESLQIEWNLLELPLPTVAEMDQAEEVAAAADASPAPAGAGSVVAPDADEAGILGDSHDLEVRERRRYLLQSHRTLRSFKEWMLASFDGDLDAAWRALEEPGDASVPLHAGDFQDTLEARLNMSGSQLVLVFEALDGPDYGGSEGRVSLAALRRALESLPEEPVREASEDPIGSALAPFVGSDCVLESLSLRACGLTRLEMGAMAASLRKSSWNLRVLNLWDNYLCSKSMEHLASAFEEFRGIEYLGLGRNRITDKGLATICTPFNIKFLDDAGVKAAQATIKQQEAQVDAAEKAKAKAKPKPDPQPGERVFREAPLTVDELREVQADEEGGETLWVLKRHCEIKTLNMSENPIKDGRSLEAIQALGPEGAELNLRGTPVALTMQTKRPELAPKGRRASGFWPSGSPSEGWVLRLL